jgi:nitrogen regulatory protein P-II 1
MKRVEAIFRPDRVGSLAAALEAKGFQGFTITDVRGHGQSPEAVGEWRGQTYELHVTHKLSIEMIVSDEEVDDAVEAIIAGTRTGALGDGLITVTELAAVYQIRAGVPPRSAAPAGPPPAAPPPAT